MIEMGNDNEGCKVIRCVLGNILLLFAVVENYL